MMMFDVPQNATLYSKIGDILQADLTVPPADRIDGRILDSMMLQQLRLVDGIWWPSTMFIRDVPGEMHLLQHLRVISIFMKSARSKECSKWRILPTAMRWICSLKQKGNLRTSEVTI